MKLVTVKNLILKSILDWEHQDIQTVSFIVQDVAQTLTKKELIYFQAVGVAIAVITESERNQGQESIRRNLEMKGRSTQSKSIYIVSDIHDGAITAVCSDNPIVQEKGEEYKPNKLQKELKSIWSEAIDELQQKPDLCVVNGEPCDGANKKQGGNQSWTTSLYDQAVDAKKLLKEIPAKEFLFIRGSGYHVQIDGTPIESFISEMMGGVDFTTLSGISANSWYWANVEAHGKVFSFTHHLPYAKFFAYRATPLAKEMALMALDKGRSMKYDVIVRSHVHYYMQVKSAHTLAFTTPAWKYPDGHLTRGGLGGIYPDIGGVEVIIESNGKIIVNEHITELKQKQEIFRVK